MKLYPYEKGVCGKSHAEGGGGGGNKFGVVFPWKLEVSNILKEGHKKFPPFKRGRSKNSYLVFSFIVYCT